MPRKLPPPNPLSVIDDTLNLLSASIRKIDVSSLTPKELISLYSSLTRLKIIVNKGEIVEDEADKEEENENYKTDILLLRKKVEDGRKIH